MRRGNQARWLNRVYSSVQLSLPFRKTVEYTRRVPGQTASTCTAIEVVCSDTPCWAGAARRSSQEVPVRLRYGTRPRGHKPSKTFDTGRIACPVE